jgi:hypothetical protein
MLDFMQLHGLLDPYLKQPSAFHVAYEERGNQAVLHRGAHPSFPSILTSGKVCKKLVIAL